MILKDVFKTYFDRYDTQGVFHNGFIQSIDLSSYVDFTFINDLSTAIVDSYLYNEFSNRVVIDRWKKFMKWDAENKRFIIDPAFYTNAVNALYVYLAKSEKFFSILNTNFSTLSATEMETINHGARSGTKQYGAQTIGRDYDKVVIELMRGTETENRGSHTDTETRGAHTDTENRATYTDTENVGARTDSNSRNGYTDTETLGEHINSETHAQYKDTEKLGSHTDGETIGSRVDSEEIGAQTIGTTKTEKIHPYDANDFVDDTQSIESVSNGAQTNGKTTGQQINSKSVGQQENETTHGQQEITNGFGEQQNTNVFGAQSESITQGAQTNSNVHGAQTNTNAYGAQEVSNAYGAQANTREYGKTTNETKERADAETRGAHTDSESVSAYIDSKTRTKVLILSPDKYYMILRELADKNIYTLFADAVKDCFLSDVFEFQALENGGIIL